MQRFAILLLGVFAYLLSLPAILYLIAFVGNLQTTALTETVPALAWLVPYSISYGRETGPVGLALLIDVALVALFGIQHSVMARSGFKRWLTRALPKSAERSVYVLVASLALILLCWQWRPIPTVIWSLESGVASTIVWTLFAAGFTLTLTTTYLIDHFDLFGLKQVWAQFRGREARPPGFKTPLFYRLVRHPLYLGFLLGFWAAPHMTVGHLVFAAGMTGYILIGVRFEERDLVTYLGDKYRAYCRRVPKLLPVPGRVYRDSDQAADTATTTR